MRRHAACLAMLLGLLTTTPTAQPNCRSVILPEPNPPQTAATGITHHIFYAPPPSPATGELWGRITYPFHYIADASKAGLCAGVPGCVAAPPGTVSVGLMYVMAQTYRIPGWQASGLWRMPTDRDGLPIDWNGKYVFGLSGSLYRWMPDGIIYVWYPQLRLAALGEPEAADGFRETINNGDSVGIDNPLSTVMQLSEGVTLGVNVLFPYREAVRSHVAFHLRECGAAQP